MNDEPRLRDGAYLPGSWGVYVHRHWTQAIDGHVGYFLKAEFSEVECVVLPGQVQAAIEAATEAGK